MSRPPDQPEDETRRWLRFAEEDLLIARSVLGNRDPAFRVAGFLTQQAAEKALKAVFVAYDLGVPKIHDLFALADNLPVSTQELDRDDLQLLNPWITAGRYPGNLPDLGRDEARSCASLPSACSRSWSGCSTSPRRNPSSGGSVEGLTQLGEGLLLDLADSLT